MLEQKDSRTVESGTIESVIDFWAKELQIVQGEGEYIPLKDRLAGFIEDPDRAVGFVFVGNDAWLSKHLISARKRQRRMLSRVAENGIVWTR